MKSRDVHPLASVPHWSRGPQGGVTSAGCMCSSARKLSVSGVREGIRNMTLGPAEVVLGWPLTKLVEAGKDPVSTSMAGVMGGDNQGRLGHWCKSAWALRSIYSPAFVRESPFPQRSPHPPHSAPVLTWGLKPHRALEVNVWIRPGPSLPVCLHLGTFVGTVRKKETSWCQSWEGV